MKDNNVTAHTVSAQNYAVGSTNFVSASRQGNFRDLEVKDSNNAATILLTGDGGDEVFGGYNKYYMGKLNAKYTNLIPCSIHKGVTDVLGNLLNTKDDNRGYRFKVNRLLKAINYEGDFYYNIISLQFQVVNINQSVVAADSILFVAKNKFTL